MTMMPSVITPSAQMGPTEKRGGLIRQQRTIDIGVRRRVPINSMRLVIFVVQTAPLTASEYPPIDKSTTDHRNRIQCL
jgi:hypothetical protein